MRWFAVVIGLAISAACASRTPPPEPQRSPAPTLPTCVTDADCPGGEECRDGECVRPGADHEEPKDCPQGCPPSALCMSGHCVEAIDAGPDAPPPPPECGDCPVGQVCDPQTGRCRASLLPSDGGPRPYEY